MADGTPDGEHVLPAGDFSAWIENVSAAIRGERAADVPCDGCTACCRSSQFVHIEPDETETLSRIPRQLLFPAPQRPAGHMLLGYDERGHCPMLGDDGCSIYEHRPRTCRTYDCRIFAAAGVEPGSRQPLIARRTRRWRFSYPTDTDRLEHEAVQAAAGWMDDPPSPPAQHAVLAIQIHDAFLRRDDDTGESFLVDDPDLQQVETAAERRSAPRGLHVRQERPGADD